MRSVRAEARLQTEGALVCVWLAVIPGQDIPSGVDVVTRVELRARIVGEDLHLHLFILGEHGGKRLVLLSFDEERMVISLGRDHLLVVQEIKPNLLHLPEVKGPAVIHADDPARRDAGVVELQEGI